MAKIHDIALPPELDAALLTWLGDMPDQAAIALKNFLPGGFRNPKLIRDRLRGMIQGSGALPPWLLAEIRFSLPSCAGVTALSVQALREQFDDLCMVAGPPQFLLALALDERPDVQRLAVERMRAATKGVSEEEKDAACGRWMRSVDETFMQFAGLMLTPSGDDAIETPIHPQDALQLETKVEEHAQTISDLRAKLDKERAARTEDRRQSTATAKADQDRLTVEIDRLTQQFTELTHQKAALEKQNQTLEAEKTGAIKSGVNAELAAIERKWLADAISTESLLVEVSGADLLLRVESALEAQKRRDRHSGNRLELQQRLQALRAADHRLRDARQNALQPVPDLTAIAEQVSHEIARIESRLGIISPTDAIADQFLHQINEAADFAALHDCSTLIDSLDERRLLTTVQPRRYYEALQRRHDILDAQTNHTGHGSHLHWLSLPSLLHRNLDCLLLLDGHNLIFALDHMTPYFDGAKPGSKARNRLVEVIRRLVVTRPNVHACVVFDGPEESISNVCRNLRIEFSGGHGEHRADDAIVRHLTQKNPKDLKPRTFVVTNDRHLQQRIRNHHSYYMPVGAFDVTLRNFGCLA